MPFKIKDTVVNKHLLHYVPHGINSSEFKPLPNGDSSITKLKKDLLGDAEYNFIVSFNSRNAHRKHPANLILAFKSFCASIDQEEAKKCALIMHTDKICEAGTDLVATIQAICPEYKVVLDDSRRSPEEMVAFYNLADVTANISSNEGFGLSIAESIMCGTPVIATVTGGLQDQLGIVTDDGKNVEFNLEFGTNSTGRHTKHGVWSKPIWTKVHNLQGSPPTPYIMDDLTNYTDIADAIAYWYLVGKEKREQYGLEGRRWAMNEGGINSLNMCDQFIKAMDFTLDNFIPVKTFDIFTEDGYDIKSLPNNKLGFDLHAVNLETIKQSIS
jgi:glycosyltransferase involved in cell wall biosynthesis